MGRTYNCAHSSLTEQLLDTYTCDGCQEMGYGSSYSCDQQCDYDLHKACYNAAPKMSHPFFKQGQFVLDKTMLPKNNNQRLCVACGTSVKGWRYVLTVGNGDAIFLHPFCMAMPHQSFRAIHGIVDCAHCEQGNEGVKGWVYVKDGVAVHVKCMKNMAYKDWQDRRCKASSSDPKHTRSHPGETQHRGCGCDCGCASGGRNQERRRRKRDSFMAGLEFTLKVLKLIGVLDHIKEEVKEWEKEHIFHKDHK